LASKRFFQEISSPFFGSPLQQRLSGTPVLSAAPTLLNSLGGVTLIIPVRFLSQEQKFYCWRESQEYNKQQIADFHRARLGAASLFHQWRKEDAKAFVKPSYNL
jgi:hypothetical protein